MAFKKITILFLPEGTNRVKKLRLPVISPAFLVLILVSCSAFLFFIMRDYYVMKAQMPRMAKLARQAELKNEQLIHLAERIDQITQKVDVLKDLDRKLKAMANIETNEDKTQNSGLGGSPISLEPEHATANSYKELVCLMNSSLDNLENEIAISKQDKIELHKFLENRRMLLVSTPSIWPTKGSLSSGFGYRTSPFNDKREFHRGIDIATRMGAPIVATADGIVSFVGREGGFGKVLIVKHGYGMETKYAHLKEALVKKGSSIKRGETIAHVGNSGRSTGPHLHYEVHLNKIAVNPLRYIHD